MSRIILFTFFSSGGGAEYVFRELHKEFSKSNNCLFITIKKNNKYKIKNHINLINQKSKNQFVNFFLYIKAFIKYIRIIKRFSPNIIISTLILPNIINIIVGLIFIEKKIIVREASSPITEINSTTNSKLKRWVKYLFYKMYSFSDRVIVLNRTARDEMFKLNSKTKIKIISNPVNKKLLNNFKECNNRKFNEYKNLIFVGRFVKSKNPFFAIDLIKNLGEEYKLIFCGDGPLIYEMRKYIAELGVTHKVHFLGFISNSEISLQMKNNCIYLSTSLFEGMSNALILAMSNNCPIIAYNSPGISDQLEDGKWGLLFDKFDVNQVASLIKRIGKSDLTFYQSNTQLCLKDMKYEISNIINSYVTQLY